MPQVARLTIYPIKSFDGHDGDVSHITPGGTLAGDREFALFDDSGEWFNATREATIQAFATTFDPRSRELTVERPDGERDAFDVDDERDALESFLSAPFARPLDLRRNTETGYVDRQSAGPSVISTATLREAAHWFDDVTVDGLRRRLRANIEVSGVDPFWEDRFVGDDAPAFEVAGPDGPVRIEGVEPCARCVVPTRDPDTGEADGEFRARFVEHRREHYPEWVDRDAFPHDYTMMLIARVPERGRGRAVRVGDDVTVV